MLDNRKKKKSQRNKSNTSAETRDRTGDLQIFSLTLSQLSYRGELTLIKISQNNPKDGVRKNIKTNAINDSSGVRTHALSDQRLKLAP